MDEDTRKFILELLIETRAVDWSTTIAIMKVCKHLVQPAATYLWRLLQLRTEWSNKVASKFYQRMIGQPINYIDVITTINTPVQNAAQGPLYTFCQVYNKPFTDNFLRDNIIAISGITLWTDIRPELIEYAITLLDYELVRGQIKGINLTYNEDLGIYYIKLSYPNRLNPIPLIEGQNGYNSVGIDIIGSECVHRNFMGMHTTMHRSIPLTIKKLIVEYVSAPKTSIDITKYNVVYDNNTNSYVKKRSLLRHVDDDSYIDPPQTAHELMLDYMFNMLNGNYPAGSVLGSGLGSTTAISPGMTTYIPLNFTTTAPVSMTTTTNIPTTLNNQALMNYADFVRDRPQNSTSLPPTSTFLGPGYVLGNAISTNDTSDDDTSDDDTSDDDSLMNEPD